MGSWSRLVLGSVLLLAGCTTTERSAAPASTASPRVAGGCTSPIEMGPLPDWADEGFSGGGSGPPHVFGAKGEILGVLFGYPLSQQPADGHNNKILWVARPAPTPSDTRSPETLVITATLDGTDTRVTHEVTGGPGPSIIDVPRAGCWHLDLRWSGRTDTMDLVFSEN
ncbi:hypothetical protein A6A27_23125 [Micromonospora sp. CB01531]|nr:hypothetical protein A6A27_23125 [Micromonospora sp. CB01531]